MVEAINVDYDENPRFCISREEDNTCFPQAIFASESVNIFEFQNMYALTYTGGYCIPTGTGYYLNIV